MYNKKISKSSLYLIITVFIVSATANQSFATLDEFSPVHMQMAAKLMNSLFNNLAQDQDIQKKLNRRDLVDNLNEMNLSLFKLQSYIAGFHNKVRQNTLDEEIFDFAAKQIHESAGEIERVFSKFCRGNSERYLKERYSYEIEQIGENLKETTRITSTDFMRDIKRALWTREPITEQGVLSNSLLSSLQNELFSLDMALFRLISTWDKRN